MTDERQSGILFESWLKDTDPMPPDARPSVARVMDKVPQVRQRGRWWPLPVFDRPVSTVPTREPAPSPIPTTSEPTPARGFTMFSAVKFVVASVIVALFGGLLLAGVLTTPQSDEVLPAAVTEPPSTMTNDEILPGAALTVEEVEPGVFRVIDDGVRDLGAQVQGSTWSLEEAVLVDDAGGVWRLTSTPGEPTSVFFRLGAEDQSLIGPDDPARERTGLAAFTFELAPDGRLATVESESARFFERDHSTPAEVGLHGIDAVVWQEDGTIWLLDSENGLVRAWPEGGKVVSDWSYLHDGMVAPGVLVVSPEGEAWLVVPAEGVVEQELRHPEAFLRFDPGDWDLEVVTAPEGIATNGPGPAFDVGPGGTLWTAGDAQSPHQRLARYDDSGWTVFGEAHGVGSWGGQRLFSEMPVDMVRVAPDGSAWLNASSPDGLCDGLARFDGTTWSSFLPGRCIGDYDFASDGATWVVAQEQHDPDYPLDELDTQTYVIIPEAVAATE